MTPEEWDDLVRRLDREANEDPGGYRRRVGLLAGLGYAYVLGVVLLLVASAAAVVWLATTATFAIIKFVIPLAVLVLIIVRSLWVRMPPPEGIRLSRNDVQPLWRVIDDLRAKVQGPKVHRLLLDGQVNAAIVQLPRLGPLGWYRNYLIVGLPLMQALDEEEFRSVVAHELGHLSKSHGRFAAWIYHLRLTWARLVTVLEQEEHWGTFIFRRFFGWYSPFFSAYTFALARSHEYEADRAAADATSPNAAARALVGVVVADFALDETYWPAVYERARTESAPPATAFRPMGSAFAEARKDARIETWLRRALDAPSGTADTHPSLSDRLRALGVPTGQELALLAESPGGSAVALLGEDEEQLFEVLDEEWRSDVTPGWREHHEQLQQARARFEELGQRGPAEPLTAEETVERAMLATQLEGPTGALPLLEAAIAMAPDDPSANFGLGAALLEAGDERGLERMERAMQADASVVLAACERAYEFLRERGRNDEAERYRSRAQEQADVYEKAFAERQTVGADDAFLPHALPPEAVQHLLGVLGRYEAVGRAFLVRKGVSYMGESWPLHVIAVEPVDPRSSEWKSTGELSLVERIANDISIPTDFHLVVAERRGELSERLEAVPDAILLAR
jgi:Zn-dependent protease with chaperone function